MKRAAIWSVGAIILLVAIVFLVRMQHKTSTVPYLQLPSLTAQKEQDKYIIKISKAGEKEKYIYFSEDRKILKVKGIEPLKEEEIQIQAGMEFTDVIARYGDPHADVGSGFYIPAYITDDAYLISIGVDHDGVVSGVFKEDLLQTNSIQ